MFRCCKGDPPPSSFPVMMFLLRREFMIGALSAPLWRRSSVCWATGAVIYRPSVWSATEWRVKGRPGGRRRLLRHLFLKMMTVPRRNKLKAHTVILTRSSYIYIFFFIIEETKKKSIICFLCFWNFKLYLVSRQEEIFPLENIFFYYFDRQQRYTHTIKAL